MSEVETIQETGSPATTTNVEEVVSFKDTLPDEYKNNPMFQTFGSVGDLAKSFAHAQRHIGVDKIPLPGKTASDEDWNTVYNKLGRPESYDKYDFKTSESFNQTNVDAYKEAAHKAGLNSSQAEKIAEHFGQQLEEAQKTGEEKISQERDQGLEQLQKEWGKAYDNKIDRATSAAKALLTDIEVLRQPLANGVLVGENPEIIKMFASLADQMSEDKLEAGEGDGSQTPAELDKEIAEIERLDGPYWDKYHPDHNRIMAESQRLRALKDNP